MRSAPARTRSVRLVSRRARLLFGVSVLSLCGHVAAQQLPPAPPAPLTPRHHSLSLDAHSVATGGTSQPIQTQSTSVDKYGDGQTKAMNNLTVTTSQQHLRYSVKNFAAQPDNARLEWYFIARPVDPTQPAPDFVFDHGTRDVSVAGNQVEVQTVDSKDIQAVSERSAHVFTGQNSHLTTGHASKRGAISAGWLMRLIADGQVVAVQAFTQHYEDVAKDEAKLKELLTIQPPANARITKEPK